MKLTDKKVFLLTTLWWFSCTTPVQVPDQTDPIERIDFEYIQARGEEDVSDSAYVAVLVKNPFNGVEVKEVKVDWSGENEDLSILYTKDLNDIGIEGDILVGDNLYGRKWSWSPENPDPDKDQSVYFKVSVLYKEEGNPVEKDTSFILGNSLPQFEEITIDDTNICINDAIDEDCEESVTLTLPTEDVAKIITIEATVSDLNGPSDIQWVGFTSKDPAKDIMLNDGNYIYLLDNGDEEVSGDIKEGDNIYTRKVAFPYNATTGSLEWKFRAQDWQGGFADSIITVTVQ